jgi:hypothetical protein
MAALRQVSGFFNAFRGLFMPLGLVALVAVGIHTAADLVDDRLLVLVDRLDAWLDGFLALSDATAAWVNRIDSRERTLIARGLALGWELGCDAFIALPLFGYAEANDVERRFSFEKKTWRELFMRLNRQPTPMRLLRPLVTLVFAVGGAYGVSRLVESTLFVGLVPDVAPADAAAIIARIAGGLALGIVLVSHGWRAVLRALQHADDRCVAARTTRERWLAGTWGTLLATPLAVVLAMEAHALLAVVR